MDDLTKITVVRLTHIVYGDFWIGRCSCGWETSRKNRALSVREAWHLAEEHQDDAHTRQLVPP